MAINLESKSCRYLVRDHGNKGVSCHKNLAAAKRAAIAAAKKHATKKGGKSYATAAVFAVVKKNSVGAKTASCVYDADHRGANKGYCSKTV